MGMRWNCQETWSVLAGVPSCMSTCVDRCGGEHAVGRRGSPRGGGVFPKKGAPGGGGGGTLLRVSRPTASVGGHCVSVAVCLPHCFTDAGKDTRRRQSSLSDGCERSQRNWTPGPNQGTPFRGKGTDLAAASSITQARFAPSEIRRWRDGFISRQTRPSSTPRVTIEFVYMPVVCRDTCLPEGIGFTLETPEAEVVDLAPFSPSMWKMRAANACLRRASFGSAVDWWEIMLFLRRSYVRTSQAVRGQMILRPAQWESGLGEATVYPHFD